MDASRKLNPAQEIRGYLDNHFIGQSDARRGSHVPSMPKYYFPVASTQKYNTTPRVNRMNFFKRITGR